MKVEVKEKIRLDKFILSSLKDEVSITRSALIGYIPKHVRVNGVIEKKGYVLRVGDIVEIDLESIKSRDLEKSTEDIISQKYDLNIIDQSPVYIVINKPKGIPVHPDSNYTKDTIANYLKGYLESRGEYDLLLKRAGIIHRLDKDVSGILLCAKNRSTQVFFQSQFEGREVVKLYLATVEGIRGREVVQSDVELETAISQFIENGYEVDDSWVRVEGNIIRSAKDRRKMVIGKSGKYSLSYIKYLSNNQVLVNIKTGRMHQIRASLNFLDLAVVNDTLYGSTQKGEGILLEHILLRIKNVDDKYLEWRLV